ncbi:MAG: mechanosensitive ion channel [Senegalia sp. (in: firmicutes)]
MENITYQFERVLETIISAIPNILMALLLLLVAWVIAKVAKTLVVKGGRAAKLPTVFQKARLASTHEDGVSLLKTLGKLVYFLVFLFMIPPILDALGMESISAPISNMVRNFLAFIPNLIGAGLILFVGWLLAKLAKEVVMNLSKGFGVDRLPEKLGISKRDNTKNPTTSVNLSKIIGNIVYALVIIPVAISALQVLNIEAISEPAINMLDKILAIIPNIIAASILIIIGVLVAKLVADLIKGLLSGTGIDSLTDNLQTHDSLPDVPKISLSNIIGEVVKYLIIILFVVQGLNVLKLDVLQNVGAAIIAYLPFLFGALITLTVGILAASFIQKFVDEFTGHSSFLGKVLKYFIIGFTFFMTLDQLKLAPSIVNLTFTAIVAALAVAFALAFGIGGREFAAKQLEKLNKKMDKEKVKSNSQDEGKDLFKKTPDKNDLKNNNNMNDNQIRKSDTDIKVKRPDNTDIPDI